MNIFILDNDINKSVEYYVNKHCVKMLVEYSQMLCSAVSLNEQLYKQLNITEIPYRTTHKHHPCVIWVSKNYDNFAWLSALTAALHKEYNYRYHREHLSYTKLTASRIITSSVVGYGATLAIEDLQPPKVMPVECQVDSVVESYRNYYRMYKQNLFAWTGRPIPDWIL